MKFGKNKAKDTAVEEKPEKKPGKKEKRTADSAGAGIKQLSAVATQQALIVVLAGVVTAVLLHFLVAIPATDRAYDRAITVDADSAQQPLNHYLSAMQDQVQAVAGQPFVADTIASQSDLRVLSQQLLQAVSGASAEIGRAHV